MLTIMLKFIFLIIFVGVLLVIALLIVGSAILGGIAGAWEVITGKKKNGE